MVVKKYLQGLSVSIANGKITFTGTTNSGSLRKRAEEIAHASAGMLQIDNRILAARFELI